MKKNKDFRVLTIIVVFVVAFVIGYVAPREIETHTEKTCVVYEVTTDTAIFETSDGNLWEAEVDTEYFTEGQQWTVVFNENNEIIDIK